VATGAPRDWNPNANNVVQALAVSDDKICGAGAHPEVVGSGGHPACRRGRASCRPEQRLQRGGCVLVRARDPPGRMPRLYGRQDARRYDLPTTSGCTPVALVATSLNSPAAVSRDRMISTFFLRNLMRRNLNYAVQTTLLSLAFVATLSISGQETKVDPTGAWNWSFAFNNNPLNQQMKLKFDGDKLVGTISGRGGEAPIQGLKLEGDQISFQVRRERGGDIIVTKYNGKISGDTILGKIESSFGGQPTTRNWDAKREARKGPVNVTGNWQYTFTTPGGQSFEPLLKLKQEGQSITGTIAFGQNEAPLSGGKIENDEVSFKVERERDGQKFATQYTGKLEGDSIKGKVNLKWGGSDRSYEFEAKRIKE